MREMIIKGFNYHKHDLEYYLEEHPLAGFNKEVYNNLAYAGGTSYDMAEMFYDIYFHAYRIYYDKYPADNFRNKYPVYKIGEVIEWGIYELDVWTAVYSLIACYEICHKNVPQLREFETCFKEGSIFKYDWDIFEDHFNRFIRLINDRPISCSFANDALHDAFQKFKFTLDTLISPIGADWKKVTNGFDKQYIKYIINSYDEYAEASIAIIGIKDSWEFWTPKASLSNG